MRVQLFLLFGNFSMQIFMHSIVYFLNILHIQPFVAFLDLLELFYIDQVLFHVPFCLIFSIIGKKLILYFFHILLIQSLFFLFLILCLYHVYQKVLLLLL
jgi:hypothetical protein